MTPLPITRASRRTRVGAALLAVVALTGIVAGCGPEDDGTTPRGGDRMSGPTSEQASPSSGPVPAGRVAAYAGVVLPEGAEVTRSEVREGTDVPVRRLVFVTTPPAAEEFCAGNDLGGALVSSAGLTDQDREDFAVTGESRDPVRRCEGVRPDRPSVNRSVLVTYPADGEAVVHLVTVTAAR